MAGQFRSSVWDPVLIVAQIITVQCIFYVSLGTWVSLVDYMGGSYRSIDQFFSYEVLQVKEFTGKLIMSAYVVNALVGAGGLWYVVQRTKLCWDFAATAHFGHFIACWVYNSAFPTTASWWITNIISVIIMTVIAEFLCMRTELKAIPLSVGAKADL